MSSVLMETLSAGRDLGRLNEVASVLIRFGFGDLVRRLGLAGVLERAGKALRFGDAGESARLEPPARDRRALEELGPTFVKLGQVMATRMDLFPPEWIAEFEKLQDHVPALPFEQILEQLREDLGADPDEVFAEFSPEPLAAASMAQVYRAKLKEGDEVIVKVRRPGIRPVVEADLRLLKHLAAIIEAESVEMARYKPKEVIRQFAISLRRELDLAGECRNAERVAKNSAKYPEIVIPKVYWEWTGERLNVQEAIQGIPGRDMDAVDKAGLDRPLLARRGTEAIMRMIAQDGFFHADPHPGNVFYLPENRIAFIDFGMVGRLSEERREQLVNLFLGVMDRDADRAVEVLIDWGKDENVDRDSLKQEVEAFIDQYQGIPLKDVDLRAFLGDLTAILRAHRLALPPDTMLLTKALISLEGMGRRLDPNLDVSVVATPFLRRAVMGRYMPDVLMKRGWKSTSALMELLADLPVDLRRLLRSTRRKGLAMRVDAPTVRHLADQLDRAASRLTMGVVIAALIIGSSVVTTVDRGPYLLGLPVLGLIGFSGAAVSGVWLLISILRNARRRDR